jgi:CRP/FNR family transcriptional regulator, anaerobic regulatory protein
MISPEFQLLFNYLQLIKNISSSEIDIIQDKIEYRDVKAGNVLLQEGKPATELFFICNGILKIVGTNNKGNAVTQFFLKENQFCSILKSLNQGVPSNESIIAACDAGLVVFKKHNLLYLYETIPYFKALIDGITQQALYDKIQIRNAYMGEDATTRYQKFIVRQPDIALRVPLSDVASYLGITQQSLSRIRKNIR